MGIQNFSRSRRGMAFKGQSPRSEFGNHSWLVNQLVSAGEGALDGATFGLGDNAVAGVGALLDAAQGKSISDAYRKRMDYEHARDAYYEENYGTARTAGEIAAALVPIPGVGLAGAGLRLAGRAGKFAKTAEYVAQIMKDGKRLKEATPLILRERLAPLGAGAVAGGAGQIYTDAANGHLTSLGDLAGATVGGALQAELGMRTKPKLSGAVGGAATSALQDLFSGRSLSPTAAARAAGGGFLGGAIGDLVGRSGFYRHVTPEGRVVIHDNADKERMGEQASRIRTRARGDRTASDEKRRLYLEGGGSTIPDMRTVAMQYIESKAGLYARLTPRQKQALAELGARFRVDHLLPKDVGAVTGFIGAQIGSQLPNYMHRDDEAERGAR